MSDQCEASCSFLKLTEPDPGSETQFDPIWWCGLYNCMIEDQDGEDLPEKLWQCRKDAS